MEQKEGAECLTPHMKPSLWLLALPWLLASPALAQFGNAPSPEVLAKARAKWPDVKFEITTTRSSYPLGENIPLTMHYTNAGLCASIMKKLFLTTLVTVSCHGALAAEEPREFRQAFKRYEQQGTLFQYRASQEFENKGWSLLYHEAVAKRFKGTPVDHLRLEVAPALNYRARVGETISLRFRLDNASDESLSATVGGSCHTVHEATFIVIDPQGHLIQNVGSGKAGGPHCFCQPLKKAVPAHTGVDLDTQTNSEAVVGFAPRSAGQYVVVGLYNRSTADTPRRSIFSAPLVLDVQEK